MRDIWKRLIRIRRAEMHAAVDQLEDPVVMIPQGIRDLKAELVRTVQGLGSIKAAIQRTQREEEYFRNQAAAYEQKATQLVQKSLDGALVLETADRLATEALLRQQESLQRATQLVAERQKLETSAARLETQVQQRQARIEQWQNEYRVLRARATVSQAMQHAGQAPFGSEDAHELLHRMREKVEAQEAMADVYEQLHDTHQALDREIEATLQRDEAATALAQLKQKLREQDEAAT